MSLPLSYKGILVPNEKINLYKWAVIACDQFTSDIDYWKEVDSLVGGAPSTLRMILPECYINAPDCETRIGNATAKMREYNAAGYFQEINNPILVERATAFNRSRKGLVMKIKLNDYEYAPGNYALIRATEGTIAERIPPRVKIRKYAPLELPHVMLLMDDPNDDVFSTAVKGRKLYETELNMDGGHITGSEVSNAQELTVAFENIKRMSQIKYGQPIMFLVGDGNHSLASAKETLRVRKEEGLPASEYALVEIVNIYDEGLVFEPIHRLLQVNDREDFINGIQKAVGGSDNTVITDGDKDYVLSIPDNAIEAIKAVQDFIDGYLKAKGGEVDYVHGENDLRNAAKKQSKLGIVMPSLRKSELFGFVAEHGVLPRKAFSLGEAEEKRYYIEAARIDLNGGN